MGVALMKHGVIAAAAIGLAMSAQASAAELPQPSAMVQSELAASDVLGKLTAEHKRKHKRKHRHWHDHHDYGDRYYRDQPVYRHTRIWRGRDGRYFCRKEDGTTGLLIGAGVGGLVGNELAGRGDKALGTLLGAVGGAILGREIDRSNARCR